MPGLGMLTHKHGHNEKRWVLGGQAESYTIPCHSRALRNIHIGSEGAEVPFVFWVLPII